jgi:hypothetical protein
MTALRAHPRTRAQLTRALYGAFRMESFGSAWLVSRPIPALSRVVAAIPVSTGLAFTPPTAAGAAAVSGRDSALFEQPMTTRAAEATATQRDSRPDIGAIS